ncbi:UDP-glycosyltransferase 86A1 [Striga hermonthica]|uniref:UDP-glycosyltransferase 86A1 n=1 Tax=Striga hermonthica TaxID=68872 RepID=A0A9N7NGV5_STRHE|nr:UDP-glycosyltransferase 86A1 [Striga hermonthica]
MNLWAESDCARWLAAKPHGSVVYVSFGSFSHTNQDMIKMIANGLVLSGLDFVWALRPECVSSEALPDGFWESVGSRGLIVPWCKQKAVLSNSAVGGFLTHCGWNSIVESIWAGVPLICFPSVGDQITNRKMVVDDWGIGIDLFGAKSVASCEEVAEKINALMSGDSCDELRRNIERVKKKLENAMTSNGSSRMNFDKFVEDLKAKMESCNSEFKPY